MTRNTSSNARQHMERRARGLSLELDRLLWERMSRTLPTAAPSAAQADPVRGSAGGPRTTAG